MLQSSIVKYVHGHCGVITESVVQNFTRHILSGLAYLHSTKTIHRDVKGANFLDDAYGVVKLADFGMAKHESMHIHYTTPPPQFRLGSIPMNLRGNWEIARRDLNNSRFIAMVSTDRNFLGTTYDEYADSTSRSLMCCRSVVAFLFSYEHQGLLCQSTLYSEQ